jgi:uncharacterized phage protein (TIGR01671 family)
MKDTRIGGNMREILFRGKRIDNGEWVEGHYVKGSTRHCITKSLANYPHYDVIPETVGQYTGLTDKNGNKIFEGDILRTFDRPFDNEIVVVSWLEYSKNLGLKVYSADYEGIALLRGYDLEKSEIIGNIFDNKELI